MGAITQGIVTAFGNTPQAGDDLITGLGITEDSVGTFNIDVMANDLGGKAKTLYSLDDGVSAGGIRPTDLLSQDAVGAINYSKWGAEISITADGKVAYHLTDAARAHFQSLGEGEIGTDVFTYAIRLASGALSWATTTIEITGVNDAPVLTVVSTGSVSEDASDPSLMTSGTLSFTDVDVNDTHTFSAVLDSVSGDIAISPALQTALASAMSADSNSWDFSLADSLVQGLGEGETITATYKVTVADNHGGSDTETVTITINGNNDTPELTVASTGSVAEDASNPNLTTSGALSFTDVDVNDGHTVTAVFDTASINSGSLSPAQISALSAGFTVDGDSWDYTVPNSAVQFLNTGQSVTLTYNVTVTDDSGAGNASDTKVVTITLNGLNEPVVNVSDPNDNDSVTGTNNASPGADTLVGTSGPDTINAQDGGDTVYGLAGNDVIHGQGGNDVIYAGSGDDQVTGDNGNDTIYGGSGDDTISGNNGNDVIVGGFDQDTLTGGNDADVFRFLSVQDSLPTAPDVVTNFQPGVDSIDVSAINSGDGGAGDFAWGGMNVNAVNNSLTYYQSGGNTFVQLENNGDGVADMVVEILGTPVIQQTDFVL